MTNSIDDEPIMSFNKRHNKIIIIIIIITIIIIYGPWLGNRYQSPSWPLVNHVAVNANNKSFTPCMYCYFPINILILSSFEQFLS